MNDELLARQFEEHRDHLRAVGYRMLGSTSEADDAVQETWLRLSRSDAAAVQNLGGWLTTVLSRVCLDMLRSRGSRPEVPLDEPSPRAVSDPRPDPAPEDEAVLVDEIGIAMMVVLDTLAPAERLTFVLHDMFAVPFDEIAPIVDRSPTATRQLASRARRRVRGASVPDHARHHRRRVVDAFLVAAREGRFEDLLTVLDPDVVLRADGAAVSSATAALAFGAPALAARMHGAPAVAEAFRGRATGARLATIGGDLGAAWAPGGTPRSVFTFTVVGDRIVGLDVIADRSAIAALDPQLV
ncbi:sigma-70 family RNA polymerase sigma factor [Rhodococcus sp. NPDC058505]|uniref:sigma-70 family RNA polymerase sigma factor n=1 Tax=unclassified Rhodococcus (in: high G+C Gram-positive bacteria) TaxID=192944 RepID=UPI003658879A